MWNPGLLPLWYHTVSCKKISFHEIFCIINVDLKPKRGASENDETCDAYIPIFVSEFGKGSSAAFAIFLKYSGNAMWFWPVLGNIYGSSVVWLENSRISMQPKFMYILGEIKIA